MAKRRLWWAAAIVAACALLGFALLRAIRHGQYAFLSDFGAEERSGIILRASDSRGIFSFTGQPAKVLEAMKRDLLADGWKLAYADQDVAGFKRGSDAAEDIAEFARVETMGEPKDRLVTCVAIVPMHPTWVQRQFAQVLEWFGKRPTPTSVSVFLRGRDLRFEPRERLEGDKVVCEITVHNRCSSLTKVEMSSLFLKEYESNETGPFKLSIAPWGSEVVAATFPAAASGDASRTVGAKYWWSSSVYSGGSGWLAQPVMPTATISGSAGHHQMVLSNPTSRTMVLKDLKFNNSYSPPYRLPSPIQLGPYEKKRIPVAMSASIRIRVVTGWWRFTINRRWVKFNLSL